MSDYQVIKALASLADCQRRIIWSLAGGGEPDSVYLDEAKDRLKAADRALMQAARSLSERHGKPVKLR